MTLIKDLIQIPEVVHKGDFVLKLTEGVTKPEQTVRRISGRKARSFCSCCTT